MIACKRMFQKLGDQLKDDIVRLNPGITAPKEGENGEAGTKTPKPKTPRKKKIDSEVAKGKEGDTGADPTMPKTKTPRKKTATDGEEPKTPSKRGRKSKADAKAEEDDEAKVQSPLKKVKIEEEDYA